MAQSDWCILQLAQLEKISSGNCLGADYQFSSPPLSISIRGDMASDDGSVRLPESLDHALITQLSPSAFYIPDFISVQEEANILRKVACLPLRLFFFDFFVNAYLVGVFHPYTRGQLTPADRRSPQTPLETAHPPTSADLALRPRPEQTHRRPVTSLARISNRTAHSVPHTPPFPRSRCRRCPRLPP